MKFWLTLQRQVDGGWKASARSDRGPVTWAEPYGDGVMYGRDIVYTDTRWGALRRIKKKCREFEKERRIAAQDGEVLVYEYPAPDDGVDLL